MLGIAVVDLLVVKKKKKNLYSFIEEDYQPQLVQLHEEHIYKSKNPIKRN